MSKIKNGVLGQYGARSFEQQQFETAGVEGIKNKKVDVFGGHSVQYVCYKLAELITHRCLEIDGRSLRGSDDDEVLGCGGNRN